jgi:hypothetical protein
MRGLGRFRGLKRRSLAEPDDGLTLVHDFANIQTGWTGVAMSIGAAGENDPESGTAASRAYETAVDTAHYFSNNLAFTQGVTYRLRTVIRGIGRTVLTVQVVDTPNRFWYATLGLTTALLSSGMVNPLVTNLGGGWYAHSVDFTLTAATGAKSVRIGAALDPLDTTYLGEITKGLHVGSIKVYSVDP